MNEDCTNADSPSGYVCTMDADCMPECCAQWRFNGKCANTGGDCKFRKPANAGLHRTSEAQHNEKG